MYRRPQKFAKSPTYFCPMQCQSKVRLRFCKILWLLRIYELYLSTNMKFNMIYQLDLRDRLHINIYVQDSILTEFNSVCGPKRVFYCLLRFVDQNQILFDRSGGSKMAEPIQLQIINMNERNILENAQYDFIGLRDIQNVNVYGLFPCE